MDHATAHLSGSSAIDEEEKRRLRWSCRRGLLELEHLLGGFLDTGFERLSPAERQAFTALLAEDDQRLNDWFFGRSLPCDPQRRALIARILAEVSVLPPPADP
ncbi:hypothetical protein GWK36_00605 [Caldichromatium japonicum]|uniref:FAD assembly factor SdhE n=1 Tax=Caldichromatium japonicum TaxID=2699430 RepID=A0A6G7VA55_9GAMM|nr:succinate dehydrogenase assembly factor 2 [Caldichromatium japonicum]QIK36746.1 hypothetical protein GWK36_00605 [Caldichromatium japonicum]